MAVATVEKIIEEITALPQDEQERLRKLLNGQPAAQKKEPLGKFVDPIPVPNLEEAMQWIHDHRHEYEEQWVALDGYRLIAHGAESSQVFAAADADGAYLPLITFIEAKPERPFVRV